MLEKDVEALLTRRVHQLGGLCLKWVSPGNSGVPDRILILPGGHVIFAELKTDTGRLSRLQRYQIQTMRDRGADVRVLYGAKDVLALIREVCDEHGD